MAEPESAAETRAEPPVRSIDYPIEKLPEIDEHGTLVNAPPEAVWDALAATISRALAGRLSTRFSRLLDCEETELSGEPTRIGSTVPGFIVARSVKPGVLALEGRHRFSQYGLIFRLEPTKDNKTLLRAETRALFPGAKGSVYKALVIGTRIHVRAVNSILRAVRRRAERAAGRA